MTRAQGSGLKTKRRVQRGQTLVGLALLAVAASLAWVMFVWLPRIAEPRRSAVPDATSAPAPEAAESVRKIKARLFYVADDGTHLTSVERDVTYAAETVEQAREILLAQLEAVSDPIVSAIPAGTTLRAVFIVGDQAFIDVSGEVVSAHPGGAVAEQLTIYALVHALTLNLPAVKSVQVLVDGREAETLAGHVDIRRPLPQNTALTIAN